jgi:hypothetical protein
MGRIFSNRDKEYASNVYSNGKKQPAIKFNGAVAQEIQTSKKAVTGEGDRSRMKNN